MANEPVAIVTGASSGIGAVSASALHRAGFVVYAVARRVDRMSALAAEGIRTLGMDVTDESSATAGVARVLAERGRIDVLVNNAGYGSYGAFEEVAPEEAHRQFDVNVFGLARLTQLVLPTMREQRGGTVINVSSIGGRIASPLGSWYHASKFAVEGLSDALRLELAPFGIRVVVIEPGVIATEWDGIALESAISTSAIGPYRRLVEVFARSMHRMEARASQPSVVAAAIVHAATARRPKTRYAIGSNAKPSMIGRRLLPDRAVDAVMRRAFGVPRWL
ncbi:oxidoreductase [Microbacterium gorillae]|uniref:oxidoreductase n=1 Tax=Microbacterium gorillae TaxID=1231063 RepID=UPI00058DD2A1|nr:oxidoreductase [Microbacterium gorillae]